MPRLPAGTVGSVYLSQRYREANEKLYVGQRKSYGTVEAIRGRWLVK